MVQIDLPNDLKMVTKMMPLAPLGDQVGHVGPLLGGWKADEKKHEKKVTRGSREGHAGVTQGDSGRDLWFP